MINKAGTFVGTSLGPALLAVNLAACAATAGAPSATPGQSLPVSPTPATLTSEACGGFVESRFTQSGLEPARMLSPTIDWGTGGMRTTDGGAHWYDASPPGLRRDAPSDFARQASNPDGYAEFYLDGNHGWVSRFFSSTTGCDDLVVTFGTSDGGHSWYESAPVKPTQARGLSTIRLFFTDARHGWFLVDAGSASIDGFSRPQIRTLLYRTKDGGRHWDFMADLLKSAPVKDAAATSGIPPESQCSNWFGGLSFASPSTGWISIPCGSAAPELFVTQDGGAKWGLLQLRSTTLSAVCHCFTNPPTFFDNAHGIIEVGDMSGYTPKLIATSDGGRSWQRLPSPPDGYWSLIDLADANNFWLLVIPEGSWNKACVEAATNPSIRSLCPGALGPPHPWLYHSGDGGRSWAVVQKNLPVGMPDTLVFFGNQGVATVAHDASPASGPSELRESLFTTSDGGSIWKSIELEALLPCCFGRF